MRCLKLGGISLLRSSESKETVNMTARVKAKLSGYRFYDFVFVLLVVISGCALAQQDTTLVSTAISSLMPKVRYALVLLFVVMGFREFRVSWTVFIPLVFLLITSFDKYPYPQVSNFLIFIELMTFCLLSEDCQLRIFRLFRIVVLAMAALGIICYVSYALNLGLPYRDVPYYFGDFGKMKYADYGYSYIYVSIGYTDYPRLCGLFNEPGYFGTILALLICIDGFDAGKLSTWLVLTAGAMTLSLAFATIIGVYLIISSVKKPKHLIFIALFALMVAYIVSSGAFYGTVLGRYMERISNFIMQRGDTSERTNSVVDLMFSSVVSGNNAIWGNGGGYTATFSPDGIASYKIYFIDYGVLGALLIFGLPIAAAFIKAFEIDDRPSRWLAICFCACFMINVVQRPAIYALPYFVLLFGGLAYLKSRSISNGCIFGVTNG